jgi:hypothetical protein
MNYRRGAIARSAECLANRARSAVILKRDRKRACRAGDNAAIQRPNCDLAAHVGRNLNIVIRTRARAREREREREGVIAIGMRRPATRHSVSASCFGGRARGRAYGWTITGARLRKHERDMGPVICAHDPGHFRSCRPLKKRPSGRGRPSLSQRCNAATYFYASAKDNSRRFSLFDPSRAVFRTESN